MITSRRGMITGAAALAAYAALPAGVGHNGGPKLDADAQTMLLGTGGQPRAAAGFTTYDPVNKAAGAALSNGNRTVTTPGTNTNANCGVRTLITIPSGLHWFEVTLTTAVNLIGLVNSTFVLTTDMGASLNSVAWFFGDGNIYRNSVNLGASGTGAGTVGDVIGFQIDVTNTLIRVAKNAGSLGSPINFGAMTGPYYAAADGTDIATSRIWTINTGNAASTTAASGGGATGF